MFTVRERLLNLEIEKGEFVGVIGHTGSGKSTMIQHFNGLLKPTSGKIYLDGEDIWADKTKIRQVRFKVGLVFQYPEYQIFEDTVYKDIAFGPKNMKLSGNEIDGRVRRTALSVGLTEDILEKSPFELSGGQKQLPELWQWNLRCLYWTSLQRVLILRDVI